MHFTSQCYCSLETFRFGTKQNEKKSQQIQENRTRL